MTATTSSQEKIDWLFGLPNGATHAANYKTEDFAAVVKQITGGKGVDVIIDSVGQSHFNKKSRIIGRRWENDYVSPYER